MLYVDQPLTLDYRTQPQSITHLLRSVRLRVFYGDLHNHTAYSDGAGAPAEALQQMRERGLHFAAITDHAEFFGHPDRPADAWEETGRAVAAATQVGFVALRGFEWTSPHQGHASVWCSGAPTGYRDTGDTSMANFYAWLRQAEPVRGAKALAGFNHPGREPGCFDACAYAPDLDEQIVTMECFNREDDYGARYFAALDCGWHLGAAGTSDHHSADWGSPKLPRTGLLAPVLSLAQIQNALLARRVFATRSPSLALLLAGNGALMGSRLALPAGAPLALDFWCDDPQADRSATQIELWTSGPNRIATLETRGLSQLSWRVDAPERGPGEHWYVARVLSRHEPLAYSSPVWVRST
jgi:hypothetical protein